MGNVTLELNAVSKMYPGVVALKDFNARFDGGKVHAVIGKNGSGKSTMVKIISGAIQPNSGEICIDGRSLELNSPVDAFNEGIATVYQELSLVSGLSVAENILLGRLPKKRKIVIDWAEAYRQTLSIMDSMEVEIPVTVKVSELGVWQQQVIEIVKAMSFKPAVIMLDEPTSALARHETENLFKIIKQLKQKGVVVIYITHRLQELYEIADTVTVLRDGDNVGTIPIEDATPKRIVNMMFGTTEVKNRPQDLTVSKEPILEVENLTQANHFKDVNFTLYRGEILGIAGMLGSGKTELVRAIFGADPFDKGHIIYNGESIQKPNPKVMKKKGIALTPENRKEEGLVQLLSTRENLCLTVLEKISNKKIVSKIKEKTLVDRQIQGLQIMVADVENPVSSLSGGNQQKVVIGNWLNSEPQVIFFDEPTRGIDVNAKQQIFQIMWDLNRREIASIFISSELEELLEVCQRILIMRHGQIEGEVIPGEIQVDDLYAICMEE